MTETDPQVKPFIEHLEDLRETLIRILVCLAVGMLIALPLARHVLGWLQAPLEGVVPDPARFLRSLQVTGAFTVTLRLAFWSGLLLSAPFILFFIGGFVFPGLKDREKEIIWKCSGFAVALFILGVAVGYWITLPVALRLMFRLHDWLGVEAQWTVTSYAAFASQLLLAFGVAFELPVVVLILGRLGILTSDTLREKRRIVIMVLLIAAMILTPPDVFTQIVMALPLIVLYELCIWLIRFWERKAP